MVHHPPGLVEPTIEYVSLKQAFVSLLIVSSVVAIHGKGAHPAHTWGALLASDRNPRDPSSHVNWLDNEDMLPAILPTARVLRFGYLSEWFGENALKTRAASIGEKLLDELKSLRLDAIDRPLIFIGHSFGGLVILKASLLWAYRRLDYLPRPVHASSQAGGMEMAVYLRLYHWSRLSWNSISRDT